MPIEIPVVKESPNWTQQTKLDGSVFILGFLWNETAGAWFLSVRALDGTAIALGRKLVVDFPVMKRVAHAQRPLGEIFAMDLGSTGESFTYADMGVRMRIMYATAAELAVARAGNLQSFPEYEPPPE